MSATPQLHRRHESIAASRDRRDVGRLLLGVAQRPAQAVDVDLEIALMDEDVRPGGAHQFVLRYQLAAASHEQVQEFEGPAAQLDRRAVEDEQLPARQKAE